MATTGPTGTGIPDPGDTGSVAAPLVRQNIVDFQEHQHRGPAFNEPPVLGSSSLLGDADLDMNGYGVVDQRYAGFTDPAAVVPPNRSIYYDDGVGFKFKTEGGTAVTLVTSAGAIPTTVGEGFVGLGSPARATYTAGLSQYAFYDDFGANNYANLFAGQVKVTNNANDTYANLTVNGTSGSLELTEDSADYVADISLPSGWNAAASTDHTISVPPPGILYDIAIASGVATPGIEMGVVGFGSWTPAIPAGTKNYTTQEGFWARIGNLLFLSWRVQYNTGVGITAVTFTGSPFGEDATIRGATGPTGVPGGQAINTTTLTRYWARFNASAIEVLDDTHAQPAGGIAGNYRGAIWVFVS